MAHYLVRARPKPDRLDELERALRAREFETLRPFGRTLTASLTDARIDEDGVAVWEEEDYCTPPLAQERDAVLDRHFDDLRVETVSPDEGWRRIQSLPRLFPRLSTDTEG